jgi:hypothetical protein
VFCEACGAAMTADQRFCPKCGKAAGTAPLLPVRSRLAGHVRLLGILWLAISAFRLIPGLILWLSGPLWIPHIPVETRIALVPFLAMMGFFFVLAAVLGFVAGWGLLERKSWSRVVAIILGVLSLFDVPFGTAIGIYTLWVLLPAKNEEEFRRLQRVA